MDTLTVVVWSMALGAIASMAFARLGDLFTGPGWRLQLRAMAYHLSVFLLVLVSSGLLAEAGRAGPQRLLVLQALVGPVCVGMSNFWIHGWLAAGERDHLLAGALRLSSLVLPAGAAAALALPPEHWVPVAALLSIGGSGLTCWATVRAWTIGDPLALPMAAGCVLAVLAIAGLHAIAMEFGDWTAAGHAAVAIAAAVTNALTGHMLWRRQERHWSARETGSVPTIDPVTKVHSSAALVQRLVAAQKRRQRTGREGALIAVTVFEPERIATLAGTSALNEVWMTLAARIQRELGVVNPVGRYWDRCFVALVETIPARRWLRRAGLRVAAALRQPVEVTGRDGEPLRVRVEFGVGVAHLDRRAAPAEDVLDEVQRLAEAARHMRSRAATTDPATGETVPVEQAQLDPPRTRDGPALGANLAGAQAATR